MPSKEYMSTLTEEMREVYRKKNRERQAVYRLANKVILAEKAHEYRAENLDKIKERQAIYRAENADKIKEYRDEYRAENADKIKEQEHSNKITCSCGSVFLRKSLKGHLKYSHDIFMKQRNLI
jgi:hypothetical protein